MDAHMKDLVILVADNKIEAAMKGILSRPHALQIRALSVDYYGHPEHDPGCFQKGDEFLQFATSQARYALVIMDYEGSGHEQLMSRTEMETDLEQRLNRKGWHDRAAAIVIVPELENWVWSDSPHVDAVTGWAGRSPSLRSWLLEQGWLQSLGSKPVHPKEAMMAALRSVGKSASSSRYRELAEAVSFERCADDSFLKLKTVLKGWFGKIE